MDPAYLSQDDLYRGVGHDVTLWLWLPIVKRAGGAVRVPCGWVACLSEVAKAASRTKGTYLNAQYLRLRGRRGPGKTTMAVAHSVLVIADHDLDQGVADQELGDDYFQQRQSVERYQCQLVRQLERLSHKLTLEPIEAA